MEAEGWVNWGWRAGGGSRACWIARSASLGAASPDQGREVVFGDE